MPRFELQSPNGLYSIITSSDPEILGKWFVETIHRDGSGYTNGEMWTLRAYPLYFANQSGVPNSDWCHLSSHTEHQTVSFQNTLEGLISVLEGMRHRA
jgi:hypothetical protein